jgi:hypothetical protein
MLFVVVAAAAAAAVVVVEVVAVTGITVRTPNSYESGRSGSVHKCALHVK